MRIKILFIILFMISFVYASTTQDKKVCFTIEETDSLIKQFGDDQNSIKSYQQREEKLRKEVPQIEYKFKKNGQVEQTITIPVENDNPLKYDVKFKINETVVEGWFPLRLSLGAFFANTTVNDPHLSDWADVKIGCKLISFAPTGWTIIQHMGLNAEIGVKSSGFSLSYELPKPFSDTAIHIFYGISYSASSAGGIGVSLYF